MDDQDPELYQTPTRTLIEGAGKANAATYAQARRQVDVVRREIQKVFATVDVLVTPTQRGVAQLIAAPQPAPTGGRGEYRRLVAEWQCQAECILGSVAEP